MTKHGYKHKIMEEVLSGKRLDAVDVGSLAVPGDTVDKPLAALEELIEDGHLKWEWFGINRYLIAVEES